MHIAKRYTYIPKSISNEYFLHTKYFSLILKEKVKGTCLAFCEIIENTKNKSLQKIINIIINEFLDKDKDTYNVICDRLPDSILFKVLEISEKILKRKNMKLSIFEKRVQDNIFADELCELYILYIKEEMKTYKDKFERENELILKR